MKFYKKVVFENYANFKGRASRAEYWYFAFFNIIIIFLLLTLENLLGIKNIELENDKIGILSGIYSLFIVIPSIAVGVRRLHDIGKSGWMFLITLIPIVGTIWLFILFILDSQDGQNKYGPNPKEI